MTDNNAASATTAPANTVVRSPTRDLTAFDTQDPAEAGTPVELEDPFTNEPLTGADGEVITWTLRGEDGETVRKVIKAQQTKRNDSINRGRGVQVDPDTVERQQLERLLAATVTYSGNMLMLDGQAMVPFTRELARTLLTDPRFRWLPEQLSRALGDRKRFLPKG